MNHLVYEDNPFRSFGFEVWEKAIVYRMYMFPVWLVMVTVLLLVLAFTKIQDKLVTLIIIGAATFLGLAILLPTTPTRYQIFNDRIRIVLGWIFHVDISFSNIANAAAVKWKDLWGLKLNFISGYSSDDILQIVRKRGAKININPYNRKLFLEHLNKALDDWRRSNPS